MKKTIVRKGYIGAMNGDELWTNTTTDETVKFVVKDHASRWELYCKHVKITIEEMTSEEINQLEHPIKYIDGDLLKLADEGKFDVIAQGCNCFCVMGSGIAPQIKKKYPEAYAVDCETTKGDLAKLGTITYTKNSTPTVVNIYSQFDTKGRRHGEIDLDYNALRAGLKALKDRFSGNKIGLPKIGAGLAGGDWAIIESIIEEELAGEDVTVVNYVPEA